MVLGFGGNDDEGGQSGVPSEEVRRLASQGATEEEIMNELRGDGYSDSQIKEALNQVLKFEVSGNRGQTQQTSRNSPRQEQTGGSDFIAPPPDDMQNERQPPQGQGVDPFEQFEMEQEPVWEMSEQEEIELEELIEEIVNEKWENLESRIDDFEEEREEVEKEITRVKEKVENLEEKHQEEKERLEEKVDKTYDHIENIETRIGSVEKAFKEFLPSLTENVRSLSGIVDQLKKNTGAKTPSTPSNYPSETQNGPAFPGNNSSEPSADIPSSDEDDDEEEGPTVFS